MPIVQAYLDDVKKNLPNKSNIMKEIEMWLAREQDETLVLFFREKPEKSSRWK